MHSPVGAPWPGGEHGEVVSPSGQRAYLAATAAALAGRSPRWASELASTGTVEAEQGHVAGRQGRPAWFLFADGFERYLHARGKWPPTTTATDWQHLLQLQGADLEAARQANAALQAENAQLKASLAQRDENIAQLAQIVAQLAQTPR
ncbi:hypothetical protein [Mycobacterium intracellulare]|jgi:hypothetical protein|uniref:hypothetical protein n=1 Tax=Mycobacterium intracellulare TaxID=1767 RepID=UPI000BAC2606|nr:hypothetical protein [Mycobacterium intracellulare]ASX03524.1 hypothetical protein CKJ58_26230 [Mycobacterium intracellulare subsp. chimaera]PBA61307.1 hypothetical protein CKJ56_13200 [Mycobacterium intracellulare subsp. chimaera]